MIVGVGIDLVAVGRIARLLARHRDRFLARCFTPGEAARLDDPQHIAGLVAAKEAAFKALGTGWSDGVAWRDVTVGRNAAGAPSLTLSGAAGTRARALGAAGSHLSISHDGGLAVAIVILESAPPT